MHALLIVQIKPSYRKPIKVKKINHHLNLIEGTNFSWDMDKLRKLLVRKKVRKSIISRILEENISVIVNDSNLQALVKLKVLRLKDLERVSNTTPRKPFLRFFPIKDKE